MATPNKHAVKRPFDIVRTDERHIELFTRPAAAEMETIIIDTVIDAKRSPPDCHVPINKLTSRSVCRDRRVRSIRDVTKFTDGNNVGCSISDIGNRIANIDLKQTAESSNRRLLEYGGPSSAIAFPLELAGATQTRIFDAGIKSWASDAEYPIAKATP
jgi:hypothetical protein